MESNILYEDSLCIIAEDYIRLKNYYFPTFSDKKIEYNQIEKMEIKMPSITTGKWRIWGSGDFKRWFPLDSRRSSRDKIFLLFLQKSYFNVGFTVESSDAVLQILKTKINIIE